MDYSLVCGHLKDGATRDESAALRALARSYAEGTHSKFLYVASENGVTSGVCTGACDHRYFVQVGACTCAAGASNVLCKHRVALCDLTGTLDRIVPAFYERFVAPGVVAA